MGNPISRAPVLSPIEACRYFLNALESARRSGLSPAADYSDWNTVEMVVRDAVGAETQKLKGET